MPTPIKAWCFLQKNKKGKIPINNHWWVVPSIPPIGEWDTNESNDWEIERTATRCAMDGVDEDLSRRVVACKVLCLDTTERTHENRLNEKITQLVCRKRKIISMVDATKILQTWSRWCALQVIRFWDCPPCVKEFLETGQKRLVKKASALVNKELEKAKQYTRAHQARYAPGILSKYFAIDAANDAILGLTYDDSGNFYRAIANDARWAEAYNIHPGKGEDAARDVVNDEIKRKQNAKLEEMLNAAMNATVMSAAAVEDKNETEKISCYLTVPPFTLDDTVEERSFDYKLLVESAVVDP